MPILSRVLRDEQPESATQGYALVEDWEVYFDNGTGGYNENGVVDPKYAVDASDIPKIYDFHPTFGGPFGRPQVVNKKVVQIHSNWSVRVRVYYRSWGLFNGGPRNTVQTFNQRRAVRLPIWKNVVLPTGPTTVGSFWFKVEDAPEYPRMVMMRVETRWRGGNEQDAITAAVAANMGTFWTIGGLLYRLSDRTRAVYDGRLFTRVDYVFERECEIQAIPANSTWGNSAAIPYLPPLYHWSDVGSLTGAPTITANYPPGFLGGQAPYPPLPGYP